MDTTGTFEMAQKFAKHGCLVTIHKHYSVKEWIQFCENNPKCLPFVAVSAGSSDNDFVKLTEVCLV